MLQKIRIHNAVLMHAGMGRGIELSRKMFGLHQNQVSCPIPNFAGKLLRWGQLVSLALFALLAAPVKVMEMAYIWR